MSEITRINLENFKQDHWSEQEINNVSLVIDFVQKLMNDHNFDAIRAGYGDHNYTQHNRNIPDSIEGLVGYVEKFAKQFPDYQYDVKRIMVDGDHVIFHSHATMKKKDRGNDKKGLNIMDVWLIKDRQITHHWDALQPLDLFMRFYAASVGGKIANNNGVFN